MKVPILLFLCSFALVAESWTDRAEYDLALAVRAQSAPAARLKLLQAWQSKYPASQMRHARAELMLAAAQSLSDTETMLAAAHEMIAADPNSFTGLYWVTVLQPGAKAGGPDSVAKTQAAAKKLAEQAPKFFASPASGLSAEAAAAERARVEALAKRTLGWVAWQHGNAEAAERDLRASIQTDPASAPASAWLGTLIASQKMPERQTEAIWHLARAAFLDGEGALPPGQRRSVRELLDAAYASYHGTAEGLDDIGQKTRSSALPPAGFKVESAGEVAQRQQDEELSRTNPELLQWLKIRRRLLAPDGEAHYQTINGTLVQGLKGYVVRCNTPSKPTEIVLGLTEVTTEEVVLQLDSPFPKCAEPGTPVQFEATPSAFTRTPFLLTMSAMREKVTGWPEIEKKR